MHMRLIGDCHGYYDRYMKIISQSTNSVQIGDMGVGFRNHHGEVTGNPPYDVMVANNARFIRGNHDNPGVCRNHKQWIPDGHMETTPNGTRIMYIGGALSIDKHMRTEGYNWWPDEELSYYALDRIMQDYIKFKPDIMITHECPNFVAYQISRGNLYEDDSITRKAFDNFWEAHQPTYHFFGHWHQNWQYTEGKTKFICIDELNYVDLDV